MSGSHLALKMINILQSAKQGVSKWHVCIGNKCWTHQMAKGCEGWRWSSERINRACRRCNENFLHLAVARSKGLPSVSYWKQSQQFGGGRMKRARSCKQTDHSDILWQQPTAQGGCRSTSVQVKMIKWSRPPFTCSSGSLVMSDVYLSVSDTLQFWHLGRACRYF